MRSFILHKQDEKLFPALGIKCANLSLKFGVLIVGEIEQQIFHEPATFCSSKKVTFF